MRNIFSIDVEDWYHLLEIDDKYSNIKNWSSFEQRIDYSFKKLLDLLEEYDTKSTCFFVGWVAEKYPYLVKLALNKGHEIACHGYSHSLVCYQKPIEFYNELHKTKLILEDLTGVEVLGFRAPGFSITQNSLWAYEILMELNFTYSSSIFPSRRAHGYLKGFGSEPKIISFEGKEIIEFPMNSFKSPFSLFNCFGGGYFRLYPYYWYAMATKFVKKSKLLIFYIHPRDLDVNQPKINLSFTRQLKSYIHIKHTERKIGKMLGDNRFTSFENILNQLDLSKMQRNVLSCGDKDFEWYLSDLQ